MNMPYESYASWEVWLDDQYGNRVKLLNNYIIDFTLIRVVNHAGKFSVRLTNDFDKTLLKEDCMVEFWRAPLGRALRWVGVCFIRVITYMESDDVDIIVIEGPDALELLDRRIIAYEAGSTQAKKTDQADDSIKKTTLENLGNEAPVGRNVSGLGLSVFYYTQSAPVVTMSFAWKKLLKTCQDLVDSSVGNGVQLFFDFIPRMISSTQINLSLQTFVGQLGMDRTNGTVKFGKEWGNLDGPILSYDYTDEVTYVYAGGQGEGTDRLIVEVSDADRLSASPWNRREVFVDARNEDSTEGVTARANAALADGRPVVRFSGTLLDSEQARYGIDWEYGDKVPATYMGINFSGIVRSVTMNVNGMKKESIQARLEVVE